MKLIDVLIESIVDMNEAALSDRESQEVGG